jgi:hypothetical protein
MSSTSYDTEDEKVSKRHRQNKKKVETTEKWQESYTSLVKGRREGVAKCIVCNSEFFIVNGGKFDVEKLSNIRRILNYFQKTHHFDSSTTLHLRYLFQQLKRQTAASEAIFVFDTVKQSHSYRSADCSTDLFPVLFKDWKITNGFACCRTKKSKIITDVLAKASVELIIAEFEERRSFSIEIDASNTGNIKMFPLVCRYFSKRAGGIQTDPK